MSLALVAALVLQVSPNPTPVGTEVGSILPDVTLPRVDRSESAPFQMSSLRGKRVLLLQFASW